MPGREHGQILDNGDKLTSIMITNFVCYLHSQYWITLNNVFGDRRKLRLHPVF